MMRGSLRALGTGVVALAVGLRAAGHDVVVVPGTLLHRVAVMSAGTLDSLPHSGAVVTLLAVCGVTPKESYRDIVMVAIVGAVIALVAVILLGSLFGSF